MGMRRAKRNQIDDDGQAVEPPTLAEVKTAIRFLKNNKATGKDKLPTELLSEQLYQLLHHITLKIWVEEVPANWLDNPIFPLYK